MNKDEYSQQLKEIEAHYYASLKALRNSYLEEHGAFKIDSEVQFKDLELFYKRVNEDYKERFGYPYQPHPKIDLNPQDNKLQVSFYEIFQTGQIVLSLKFKLPTPKNGTSSVYINAHLEELEAYKD